MSDTPYYVEWAENQADEIMYLAAEQYKKALDRVRVTLMQLDEERPSYEYQKQRLNDLKVELIKQIKQTADMVQNETDKARLQSYINGINTSLDVVNESITRLNETFVRSAIDKPIDGANWYDYLHDRTKQFASEINDIISQDIALGESLSKITNELKDRMNVSTYFAYRIARTETLRAASYGRLEGTKRVEDRGFIVAKKWHTIMDGRQRDLHGDLNNVICDPDGLWHIDGIEAEAPRVVISAPSQKDEAGFVINCRCSYDELIIGKDGQLYPEYDNDKYRAFLKEV